MQETDRFTASAESYEMVDNTSEDVLFDHPTMPADRTPETGKTDKTDHVSNADFLEGIFRNRTDDQPPLVVSFPGNPVAVNPAAWRARPWQALTLLPADRNNYFALGTFHRSADGHIGRRKKDFAALHALMLDDIGSKVNEQRITLPPSWRIETSPGNFQLGFILAEPITDGLLADRVMDAIIAAGLCDPGSSGPRTRLARLPVAVNGKHSPVFRCRLTEWAPDRRYTVEDMVRTLQLDMRPPGRAPAVHARGSDHPGWDSNDTVQIPCPPGNPVIAALRERSLYKMASGHGRHDITCPWVSGHTDGIDSGTAYFEPDDNWPLGGFKCLHSHGARYHIRDLLDFLDVPLLSARMKPVIRLIPGEIDRIVDVAEQNLAGGGRHYQCGGLIVTVVTDPDTRESRIQEVSQPALVRALSAIATWQRFDARKQGWTRCDPPARHTSVLFDARQYDHLPILRGIARQPYLRADGSLSSRSGYDAATGMFGAFDARHFTVPSTPTRRQVSDAIAILNDLLDEFVFAAEHDRSAALCAMLTAAVRPSLPAAPMFHAQAHQIGSGKTYLTELITAFATPQYSTPAGFPSDNEECSKLLLAEFLRAPAVLVFDNLTGDLIPHRSLCTALTSGHMTGRILGVSKTATVSTRVLILSSGNNVGPVADMTRRCVTVSLNPGCETPATRTFRRPDLVRNVLENRGRYVSAALTVVRGYLAAGRPEMNCIPLAGYLDWSQRCRQPLLWLGFPDPATSVFAGIADDPDRATLERLLVAWKQHFGTRPTMVRDIVSKADSAVSDTAELRDVLNDIAGERDGINRRRLGRWIKHHAGQVADGLKLVRMPEKKNAECWRIESVTSVTPVPCTQPAETVSEPDVEVF